MTVCGIAQLALDLFDQNFPPPLRAVTFDDVSCTSITMALSGVVTDTDSHIRVERANRYGTGRLQRIAHGCIQIVGVVIDGHQTLLSDPPIVKGPRSEVARRGLAELHGVLIFINAEAALLGRLKTACRPTRIDCLHRVPDNPLLDMLALRTFERQKVGMGGTRFDPETASSGPDTKASGAVGSEAWMGRSDYKLQA